MNGYVVNFTVYTMAMLGLICFAVFVYKKVMAGGIRKDNTKFLSIEDSMSLNPRKSLHVVRAGDERFLIAADVDRTTLISKLSSENVTAGVEKNFERFLKIEPEVEMGLNTIYDGNNDKTIHLEGLNEAKKFSSRFSKQNIDRRESQLYSSLANSAMMQEMAKKINEL